MKFTDRSDWKTSPEEHSIEGVILNEVRRSSGYDSGKLESIESELEKVVEVVQILVNILPVEVQIKLADELGYDCKELK